MVHSYYSAPCVRHCLMYCNALCVWSAYGRMRMHVVLLLYKPLSSTRSILLCAGCQSSNEKTVGQCRWKVKQAETHAGVHLLFRSRRRQ